MESVTTTHRSLHELVADRIRTAILDGELAPGERLVEDRLAQELAVSRHPVREGLRTLQLEGLVDISPRRGATVALTAPGETEELFEILAALDGLAARLASAVGSKTAVANIAAVLSEAAAILEASAGSYEAADLERLSQLNRDFHRLIADASGNQQLIDTIARLRDRIHRKQAAAVTRRPDLSWREHRKLCEAIADASGDLAEQTASAHINAAKELIAES